MKDVEAPPQLLRNPCDPARQGYIRVRCESERNFNKGYLLCEGLLKSCSRSTVNTKGGLHFIRNNTSSKVRYHIFRTGSI